MKLRVALIGATGLVGSGAARALLDGGWTVEALLRRPGGIASSNLREHVESPEKWPAIVSSLSPDAAVSALGTTIRVAGSRSAFRAVDLDMVVAFAAAARAGGARRMVAVSSVGADPGSSNFYLRTKGEMESALAGLGFERLDILQPGLLLGNRGGERRTGERIAIALSPVSNLFLRGRLDRFAAIEAEIVAAAVAGALGKAEPGVYRHDNRGIRALASAF